MGTVGERLKEVRKYQKIATQSELSKALKWKRTRVQDIESGKVLFMRGEEAKQIADKYGIDGWWLLTGEGAITKEQTTEDVIYVNSCMDKQKKMPLPRVVVHHLPSIANLMYYLVATDAMVPTINMGDIVIIDENSANLGDGMFVIEIEGNLTCRRLQFLPNKQTKVFQDNKTYEPITVDSDKVKILGRVVARFSIFRQ